MLPAAAKPGIAQEATAPWGVPTEAPMHGALPLSVNTFSGQTIPFGVSGDQCHAGARFCFLFFFLRFCFKLFRPAGLALCCSGWGTLPG